MMTKYEKIYDKISEILYQEGSNQVNIIVMGDFRQYCGKRIYK